MNKPKRVKAKITRTVTEIAIVTLNRDGQIEEVEEIHETVEFNESVLISTLAVLSTHEGG